MEETAHRESLTDIAEKKIFHYLRENRFRPGDRLPMEEEFADMFQTSRTIIREALSRLRMMGFIESKKRRGMVVARPTIFETIAKVIDPAFLDEEEQKDFFRLRITIELGLADMLAEQLSEEDLADLEQIVREEETDPADYRRFLDCDYRFHSRIYQATRCRSLASFQRILLQFFTDFETRVQSASSNFARRFDDPEQFQHPVRIGVAYGVAVVLIPPACRQIERTDAVRRRNPRPEGVVLPGGRTGGAPERPVSRGDAVGEFGDPAVGDLPVAGDGDPLRRGQRDRFGGGRRESRRHCQQRGNRQHPSENRHGKPPFADQSVSSASGSVAAGVSTRRIFPSTP